MYQSPKQLETEIAQLFKDESLVLLDLNAVWQHGRLQLRLIGDRRDGGLSIDDCVYLTRQVQHLIDEKRLVDGDYRLEVSSPGLDYPLRAEWQFVKNIGRLVKVTVNGERGPREISGRLTTVDASGVTLATDRTAWTAAFSEILSAKVLPEFHAPRTETKP